jgi:hypothetical protein
MNQSSNIIIKVRGKEYVMTKEHYIRVNFAPKLNKKPGYVKADLYLKPVPGHMPGPGKPAQLVVESIGQKEWKRLLGLGLFRFVPDTEKKHLRRFYIKD